MKRQLCIWTSRKALAVSGLLMVWIVWYISAIPTWRKDIDNLLSNMKSTLRFIYENLSTILTWKSSLNFISVYYLLVLHRSQRGYFSSEVQSCTFIFSSISRIYISLFILGYSDYIRWRKSSIRKWARRYFGVQRKSENQPDSVVIQRILLLGYSSVGTTPSAEAKQLCCFI